MSKLARDSEKKEFGERLLRVRLWVGQVQDEFALTLELAPRAYGNYERGEREMPSSLLLRIYQLYKVDPVWLLTGKATAKESVIPENNQQRMRGSKRR